jgi:hypothetical protein
LRIRVTDAATELHSQMLLGIKLAKLVLQFCSGRFNQSEQQPVQT